MEEAGATRRQFIATLGVTLAGLMLAVKYLTPRRQARRETVTLSPAAMPVDGALVYRQERLAVVNDGGIPFALGLVCTHLGCTVSVTPDGVVCPCHGSRFDRHGNVLAGPADKSLPRYPVTVSDNGFVVTLSPLPPEGKRRS